MIAGVALLGQAVMGLGAAGLALLGYWRIHDNASAAQAANEWAEWNTDTANFSSSMMIGMAVYSVLVALFLLPVAIPVFRGSRIGQIAAWAVGGLMVLVGCCAYPLLMINGTGNNAPQCVDGQCSSSVAYRSIVGIEVMIGMSALTIIQWLLIVATGIMLVLPPVRRYIRSRSAQAR